MCGAFCLRCTCTLFWLPAQCGAPWLCVERWLSPILDSGACSLGPRGPFWLRCRSFLLPLRYSLASCGAFGLSCGSLWFPVRCPLAPCRALWICCGPFCSQCVTLWVRVGSFGSAVVRALGGVEVSCPILPDSAWIVLAPLRFVILPCALFPGRVWIVLASLWAIWVQHVAL